VLGAFMARAEHPSRKRTPMDDLLLVAVGPFYPRVFAFRERRQALSPWPAPSR